MSVEQIREINADRQKIESLIDDNRKLIDAVRSDRQRETDVARAAHTSLRRAQARIRRAAYGA